MTLSLYTLHSTTAEGEFIIQKFDTDYRCESVYAMTSTTCMCPQGAKPTCRHRKMFPLFLKHGHIGDGWFLEWDTRMWRKPIIEPEEMVSRPSVGEEALTPPSPGADQPSPEATPPSPPEGPQSPQAAEAAPASPVGVGAPIVKRRRIS
jgi:hypothetical protein